MKVGRLFNLLQDAQDILSFFDNVTTSSQMVSCLERMKRGQALLDFADTVQSLRTSVVQVFDDGLELGGELPHEDDSDNLADELLLEVPFDNSQVDGEETPSQEPTEQNAPSNEKPVP
jgi:hypothetical protein